MTPSPNASNPAAGRDTLWLVIGITVLWLSIASVLLLTGAKILATAIECIKP